MTGETGPGAEGGERWRPVWHEAVAMAARLHERQHRRDRRTPYASHVFRVVLILSHELRCRDDDVLAAAALHDVIEDTPADFDDVRRRCGDRVASLVAAMTKDMRLAEPEREPAYERQVAAAEPGARLIKLADLIDNLRDRTDPGEPLTDRDRRSIDKARAMLAAIESAAGNTPEVETGLERVRALLARLGG